MASGRWRRKMGRKRMLLSMNETALDSCIVHLFIQQTLWPLCSVPGDCVRATDKNSSLLRIYRKVLRAGEWVSTQHEDRVLEVSEEGVKASAVGSQIIGREVVPVTGCVWD